MQPLAKCVLPYSSRMDAGSVRIDGRDVRDVTLASLAECVGMVAQETYLVHDTIRENLKSIRGSQLVYLPNCGHAPMLERPEAFNAAVAEWLVETRARRGVGGRS